MFIHCGEESEKIQSPHGYIENKQHYDENEPFALYGLRSRLPTIEFHRVIPPASKENHIPLGKYDATIQAE
jgi:hypothetical protein